jgi:hypothetical protein
MQLGFADSDSYDMNITKADDHSDITKRLKSWFATNGDVKLCSIDDIRRKVRGSMVIFHALVCASLTIEQVSFNGFVTEIVSQVPQADDFWLNVSDTHHEIIVKLVCSPSFDKSILTQAVGQVVQFKHVYIVNKDSVFFDEMSSIPSSFIISPPSTQHLLDSFTLVE